MNSKKLTVVDLIAELSALPPSAVIMDAKISYLKHDATMPNGICSCSYHYSHESKECEEILEAAYVAVGRKLLGVE